jgi:hypothetical protein
VDKACFASSKLYAINYKNKTLLKLKGISKNNINFSFEEFENFFYKKKKKTFSTTIFNKKNLNMKIENVEKEINFNGYNKRVFIKNKKYTIPLKIFPI